MHRVIPNFTSGITAVVAYAPDAIFRFPVVAWYAEDFDTEDSPIVLTPMVPESGHLVVARGPIVGLEFVGCEPSDWTARVTAYEEKRKRGAT